MNLRDVIQPAPKRTIRRDIGGLAVMMAVMGLVLAGIGVAASCSGAQKTDEKVIAACVAGDMGPVVEGILSAGSTDAAVIVALESLGTTCGHDVITLLVDTFEKKATAASTTVATSAANAVPLRHARAYLAKHPAPAAQ